MNYTIHDTIHDSKFRLSDIQYDPRFNYHALDTILNIVKLGLKLIFLM